MCRLIGGETMFLAPGRANPQRSVAGWELGLTVPRGAAMRRLDNSGILDEDLTRIRGRVAHGSGKSRTWAWARLRDISVVCSLISLVARRQIVLCGPIELSKQRLHACGHWRFNDIAPCCTQDGAKGFMHQVRGNLVSV